MEKEIIKECKTHGDTTYILRADGRYRCKKCASESVIRRRKNVKIKAVEYKGNSCEICGYDRCVDALHFHHLDPNKKDFGIAAGGFTRSWEKIRTEIDKCIMVCANCHSEIHAGIVQLEK